MKNRTLILSGFLILQGVIAANSHAFAFSASYDQKVSVSGTHIATVSVKVKEQFMRAESDFGGMKTIMFRNSKGVFSYLPEQKVATQIPASLDRPNLTKDIPHYMDFLKANNAVKVGSEKFQGYDCDVYKFIEPTIKKEGKAWVWKEKKFPVKIEVNAAEGLTVVEMANIKLDQDVPNTEFDLPKNTQILQMNPSRAVASAPQDAQTNAAPAAEALKKK